MGTPWQPGVPGPATLSPMPLLTDDQRQLLAAAARVARRRVQAAAADPAGVLRPAPPSPDPTTRTRSLWGWGHEGVTPDALQVEVLLEVLKDRFGLEDFATVVPPRIGDLALRAPRFSLPAALQPLCTDDPWERATHTYGKAFRDLVRGLHGQFDNPPDWVAVPETEDQILSLMQFCEAERVALVPFGGGTSVVGGVEPTRSDRYQGTLTLDLRRFNRVLEVDPVSRAARAQAGLTGPALEAALKPHGLSTRFYPQSFEFSTLGGWIATRAGGHHSTVYTHIDDLVQSVRVVTPRGVHETRRLPASGAGPAPERLWLGSEGSLGVITEAWVRLHARPTHRSVATVRFGSFAAGAEAVRALSQRKLYPATCRLVSALEAVTMGLGTGRHAMLLLGFEAEHDPQRAALETALSVCRAQGGRVVGRSVRHTQRSVRSGSAGTWRSRFLKAPYLRDVLAQRGLVTETFETAVTWDRFAALHAAVQQAAEAAFAAHCQGRGLLTCRFTHVYPDGPAPYYSVVAWAPPGRQLETWDAVKAAVSDALMAAGGTITHHHAVGRDHRPWHEQERGPLFTAALAGAKDALDPGWVCNPGVLLAERG